MNDRYHGEFSLTAEGNPDFPVSPAVSPGRRRWVWDDSGTVNRLDLFLLALAFLVGWTGYRRGALRQILSWGGLVLGLVLGATLAPRAAALAQNPLNQVGMALGAFLIGGVVGIIFGKLFGRSARAAAKGVHLGLLDSAGGAGIALVALGLIVWFITLNLVNGPFPGIALEIRESVVIQGLDSALPEPPSLLSQVRDFFNRFGFPQVFAGLPPAPAGPVVGPTQEDASAAFEHAAESTVRVVGRACDQILQGTGFVVAPNYVLTNAHVVAGVGEPQIQIQGGATQAATTVLFDPDLDDAVLRVAEAPGPVLPLAGEDVARGTGGAVLGYPGGGDLTGVKAAVRQVIQAEGRDIYGGDQVTREVYELQTEVMPGNSGGPFVMTDGTVAGLVFAASTTEKGVGYAITSTELQNDLHRAVVRFSRVPTGSCIR